MRKIIFIFCLCIKTAFALSVPFEPVQLSPNQTLQASYSFGLHAIIVCFDPNQKVAHGLILWPYQGQSQSSTLPVLLKLKSMYEGRFADPNGIITVTNNTNEPMFVSCLFGF